MAAGAKPIQLLHFINRLDTLQASEGTFIQVPPPTAYDDPGIINQWAVDSDYFYIHNGATWLKIPAITEF